MFFSYFVGCLFPVAICLTDSGLLSTQSLICLLLCNLLQFAGWIICGGFVSWRCCLSYKHVSVRYAFMCQRRLVYSLLSCEHPPRLNVFLLRSIGANERKINWHTQLSFLHNCRNHRKDSLLQTFLPKYKNNGLCFCCFDYYCRFFDNNQRQGGCQQEEPKN